MDAAIIIANDLHEIWERHQHGRPIESGNGSFEFDLAYYYNGLPDQYKPLLLDYFKRIAVLNLAKGQEEIEGEYVTLFHQFVMAIRVYNLRDFLEVMESALKEAPSSGEDAHTMVYNMLQMRHPGAIPFAEKLLKAREVGCKMPLRVTVMTDLIHVDPLLFRKYVSRELLVLEQMGRDWAIERCISLCVSDLKRIDKQHLVDLIEDLARCDRALAMKVNDQVTKEAASQHLSAKWEPVVFGQ